MFADMGAVIPEPAGTIKGFYGVPDDVPAGWHLCDGTDGTPDFRDRFLVCAGGLYDKGELGGVSSHSHTAQQASHLHVLLTYPRHIEVGTPAYGYAGTTDTRTPAVTVNTKATLPPFIGLYWIIKL